MVEHLTRDLGSLRHGDHLCLPYDHVDEKTDAVIPFIAEGLGRGERCVYIADADQREALAGRAFERRRQRQPRARPGLAVAAHAAGDLLSQRQVRSRRHARASGRADHRRPDRRVRRPARKRRGLGGRRPRHSAGRISTRTSSASTSGSRAGRSSPCAATTAGPRRRRTSPTRFAPTRPRSSTAASAETRTTRSPTSRSRATRNASSGCCISCGVRQPATCARWR